MLAGARIDPKYEHEPSWAAGPVGRRGGCDRQLHADAVRRVRAYQPAVNCATPLKALRAARERIRASASRDRLPAGIALRHIRVISGRIPAIVPSLRGGGLAVVIIAIVWVVIPPIGVCEHSTEEKPVIAKSIAAEPAIVKSIPVEPALMEPALMEPASMKPAKSAPVHTAEAAVKSTHSAAVEAAKSAPVKPAPT